MLYEVITIICSISASTISFSNDAVRPHSSQPAACTTRLACPSMQAHRDCSLSQAACASTQFDEVVLLERNGSPSARANWPLAMVNRAYSGVPSAGAPLFV